MDDLKPVTRWVRFYWDEEDVTFFIETDEDGWPLRQVELKGPDKVPTVASALAEYPNHDRDGLAAVRAYETKYGILSDQPIEDRDDDIPLVDLERSEFEDVWQRARAHLDRS